MPGRSPTWRFQGFCGFGGVFSWPGHGFRAWGWGLPLVCWIEPHFVGPADLPVKSTTEPFQLSAQLSVGHAATVKLPLPVRCGVTSGGSGTPRSWRDWIRALATARSSSSVCSGVSPKAMQPCRVGTSARYIQPSLSAGS